MGFFKSIWNFLKGLVKSVLGFLKKVWDWVRPFIAIVLLIAAIWLSFGAAIPAIIPIIGGLEGMWAAFVFAGLSAITSPETFSKVVTKVGEAVAVVGGAVAEAATSIATSAVGSFLKSPIGIGVLAFGAWYFFGRDKDEARAVLEAKRDEIEEKKKSDNPVTSLQQEAGSVV